MTSNNYDKGRLNLPFVGMDLVEVAPDYDLTFSTSTLAAQLLMSAIGRILHYKIK